MEDVIVRPELERVTEERLDAVLNPAERADTAVLLVGRGSTDPDANAEVCKAASGDEIVVPANYNSPGQVVIGGHAPAVDRAIALLAERGLLSLLAPVVRVTGYDTVIPLPRLERDYMPSVTRIVAAGRQVCKFG